MNQVTRIHPDQENVPHSTEAEQQLLGAMLLDNTAAEKVAQIIGQADFYDPVHGRIFAAIMGKIERDEVASPVTIKAVMAADDGLRELSDGAYLARLAGGAIASYAVKDYAKLIRDAAARREALVMLQEAQAALKAGAEATGDIMGRLESGLVDMQPADSKLRPLSLLGAITGAVKEIDSAYHGDQQPAIISPFNALYRIMPYSRAGDMVVVAGRPSMGKSAVALSYATASAWNGHPVVIASLEMTPEDMAMRALSEATSEAGMAVSYSNMSAGALSEQQFRQTVEAAKTLESLPIQFLGSDFRKPGALLAGVKQALRTIGPMDGKTPLIIVDYMQLMDGKGRDLREQMTDVSKQMKHLARSVGGVCMPLSQLSRGVESRVDKRPMLSDLRETGQIEQDADSVPRRILHRARAPRRQQH